MTAVPARRKDETGMTLVEVIVYSSLTVVTLSALGGMFAAGLRAQAAARELDAAAGAAHVAVNSLQAGVRNASNVLASGGLLKARVASGTGGWQCAAWALTADGELVYTASPAPITSTDYSSWTVLATGAAADGGDAFDFDSTQVTYRMVFTSGSAKVPIAGVVVPTALGPGSPASCW